MRVLRYTILCIVMMISLSVFSDSWWSVWGSAGFPMQLDNSKQTSAMISAGGYVGTGWTYRYQHFLMNIGIETGYTVRKVSITHPQIIFNRTDENMHEYMYNVTTTNHTDTEQAIEINVPLLFGAEFQRFYFLLGPEFNYRFLGNIKSRALVSTTGDFDRYYETLEDMPNHGFWNNKSVEASHPMHTNWDIQFRFEVGAMLYPNKRYSNAHTSPQCRLGAFVDYGIRNMAQPGSETMIQMTDDLAQPVNLSPFALAKDSESASIHNFMVGIRCCVMIPLSKQHKYPCHCDM